MFSKIVSSGLASLLCQSGALAGPLELQERIPQVTALNQEGKNVELANWQDEPWLLVYFFPKADTPGCTKQACSLRDSYEQLLEQGVKVVGVSKNSVADQKKFADKYNLPFTLLADHDAEVIRAFGVAQYPAIGLAHRQAFLFRKGQLVWRDLKAATDQQAAEVLRQVQP